jgi:hypothetical protein
MKFKLEIDLGDKPDAKIRQKYTWLIKPQQRGC